MFLDPIFHFFNYLLMAFTKNFLNNSAILQILGSLASFLLAFLCSKSVLLRLEQVKMFARCKKFFHQQVTGVIVVSLWMLFEIVVVLIGLQTEIGTHISRSILSFLATWLVIKIVTQFIKDPSYNTLVRVSLWSLSTLLILGLFNPIVQLLHQLSITIGTFHLSLWMLIKATITLLIVVWIALAMSRWAEKQIHSNRYIEPSSKVLLSKFTKMAFVALGILLGLSNIGFDLSIFTLFGGAIGVGIGFGLQKVVSNLICGIVLLLDRTVKPGDVIALGSNNFGIVNRLGARCVSVRTLAGEEHLIPNEEMITSKVENWSYTDTNLRVEVTIRVSFNEDVDLALRLLRQAAFNVRRILLDPRPVALIQNISEYAIELSLRVWIEDAHLGLGEVKSELYFNILRLFRQHQIQIPYPHQNIFLPENKELFSFEKSSPKVP
jgi:small-conductance mechanosensitive channel